MCSRGPANCLALGFSQLLLLPAFILVARAQDNSIPLVTALSESTVILHISDLPTYTSLIWMSSDKQMILKSSAKGTVYANNRFTGRVSLRNDSALRIFSVDTKDSSTYLLTVTTPDGDEVEKKIRLQVFDPVPYPTISIRSAHLEDNRCILNLSCVVPAEDVTYTWLGDPALIDTRKSMLEVSLQVNISGSYTCEVSNPVSSKNTTVEYTLPCMPGESSGMTWGATWHIVLWPTLLLVLLV